MKSTLPLVALALCGSVLAAGAARANEPIADSRLVVGQPARTDDRGAQPVDTAGTPSAQPLERRGGRVVGSRNYSLHPAEEPPGTAVSQAHR